MLDNKLFTKIENKMKEILESMKTIIISLIVILLVALLLFRNYRIVSIYIIVISIIFTIILAMSKIIRNAIKNHTLNELYILVGHDKELAERLIQSERKKNPSILRDEAIINATERLVRDRERKR
jgi:hypothetical protein